MKSLAIAGMMFLSMGLFAQQPSRTNLQVKEKKCLEKRIEPQEHRQVKKTPIQQVDARKSTVRSGNRSSVGNHKHVDLKKANAEKRSTVVPLRKKSAKVAEKM